MSDTSTIHRATGVVAFSTSDSNCFLVLPSKENAGEVVVYDALNLKV